MVTIPQNTYEVQHKCREEVVQMIVNAFLLSIDDTITVKNYGHDKINIEDEVYIYEYTDEHNREDPKELLYGFGNSSFPAQFDSHKHLIRKYKLRRNEIDEAIRLMRKSGYFFYQYRHGYAYQCITIFCSKRELELSTRTYTRPVISFDYIID